MKKELNRKIEELCDSAGTEAARDMAARLTEDLDKRFDDRVAAGMSELDAYRDVLRNVDEIEAMLKALPPSDAEIALEDRRAGAKTLDFYLGQTAAVMWVTTVIAFFLVGMSGGAWEYAWLVFLWSAVGQIILNMTNKYNRKRNLRRAMRSGLSGILWVGTTIVYFLTGLSAGDWGYNWLLFLCAAAAQIVLDTFLREK